jgi:omega-6 fatty acid desaturase (delta-12 desaturase)
MRGHEGAPIVNQDADTDIAARRTPDLYSLLSPFRQPSRPKSTWQLLNTLIPYAVLWTLMVLAVRHGHPGVAMALCIPAAALLVRVFIIFHDCCHGSFFASRRANRIVGYVTGILACTPFERWQRDHAQHHATVGDLDRRGAGDVWTLTADEYLSAPRRKRLFYRVFRNPFVMLGVGPAALFFFVNRFSTRTATRRERFSIHFTNLALLLIIVLASVTIGLRTYLSIQVPVMLIAGACGVWLFYVQHQFEDTYWARHADWDPMQAAMEGSSYYKLPGVLRWVTASIGLHHIHHVQPRIPNYNLQKCQEQVPAFQAVRPLTIGRSLHSLRMRLWDEKRQCMVSWASLKAATPPR